MADPLSLLANITAIIGISAQSCQFLLTFFTNISDAPAEIQHYSVWLRALLSALSELEKLSNDASFRNYLSFDADFEGRLKACRDDLLTMESRARAAGHELNANPVRRTWAKLKYGFLADHFFEIFSWRLQMYQATFATTLAATQL
jgi:Fungal N-terminal domain of STAND proteins